LSFASLARRFKWTSIAVFDVQGYFDESWDDQVLCVTVVCAEIPKWEPLESAWKEVLREEGDLTEFKSADCHHRKGVFRDARWRPSHERLRVRDRFIDATAAGGLVAICIGVDVTAFRAAQARRPILDRSGYNHPYYLAFATAMQSLVMVQAVMNVLPHVSAPSTPEEFAAALAASPYRLGLVVDRNDQRKHQVLEIFNDFKDTYANFPVGELAFGDSIEHPGIQAADLIAYETRMYLADFLYGRQRSDRDRWPGGFKLLVERSRQSAVTISYYDADNLRFTEESFKGQRERTELPRLEIR
jgi:hypothetical protein